MTPCYNPHRAYFHYVPNPVRILLRMARSKMTDSTQFSKTMAHRLVMVRSFEDEMESTQIFGDGK